VLKANLESSIKVHQAFIAGCLTELVSAAQTLAAAYRSNRKAIFFGNGGSAADAQHLAAEFVGRYLRERRPLPALALNVNTSVLTGIGNDYGYAEVFARQIEALGVAGDVAVGLSTSGKSRNVIEAMARARKLGMATIALTGASGGDLRGMVDTLIAVPSDATPRIQECHILAGHALCDIVESVLTGALPTQD
jgi:D-sedoheptulose 7-phosphate isomerase